MPPAPPGQEWGSLLPGQGQKCPLPQPDCGVCLAQVVCTCVPGRLGQVRRGPAACRPSRRGQTVGGRWGVGTHGLTRHQQAAGSKHGASRTAPPWALPPALRVSRRGLARVTGAAGGPRHTSDMLEGGHSPPWPAPCWDPGSRDGARGSWSPEGMLAHSVRPEVASLQRPIPANSPPSCLSRLLPGVGRPRKDPVPRAPVATVALRGDPSTPAPSTSTGRAPMAPSTPQPTGGCLGTARLPCSSPRPAAVPSPVCDVCCCRCLPWGLALRAH